MEHAECPQHSPVEYDPGSQLIARLPIPGPDTILPPGVSLLPVPSDPAPQNNADAFSPQKLRHTFSPQKLRLRFTDKQSFILVLLRVLAQYKGIARLLREHED